MSDVVVGGGIAKTRVHPRRVGMYHGVGWYAVGGGIQRSEATAHEWWVRAAAKGNTNVTRCLEAQKVQGLEF